MLLHVAVTAVTAVTCVANHTHQQGDAFMATPSAAAGGGSPSGSGPETAFGRITSDALLLSDRALEMADAQNNILVKYMVRADVV